MQQLQSGVTAQDGGHHRPGEIPRQRGIHRGADHVGQPKDRHGDIGPTPAQPAGVPLDIHTVAGEALAGRTPATAALGMDNRVVRV